jgi:hypothetical protein
MSAHYEHTVWVKLDSAEALTRHDWCEEAIKKNKELSLCLKKLQKKGSA